MPFIKPTQSPTPKTLLVMCVMVMSLVLTACGGGGSSTETSTPAAAPTPSGTPSATPSATPTPVAAPTPAPAPTASECPIGNYKADVQAAVNAARAVAQSCGAATGALSWNGQLEAAAAVHSNDMAVNNYFGHPDASGLRVGARVSATGYAYRSVSENIAGGQTSASQVVADWIASPSHCASIMTASFVDIGVSCKYSPTSTYQYYWTLVMGYR
jgi:uncharacterized protein YkwD